MSDNERPPIDHEAETTSSPPEQPDHPEITLPPPAALPETIGHYRIIRKIGSGGMGTVYEAEQEAPRRTVALKVIRPGVASTNLLRRFEHEAQILGKLDHPGIATVFEAGTFDAGAGPQPFFAMELVRGQLLTDYAIDKKLGTRQRLQLLASIAEAVQHAHQKGIIHRDLKPANILVTEDGQPKILDFGVARATDADIQTSTLQTDIGQLIGTVPYMSPEQAAGDPDELDTRSDVYALGVVAYELLAGRLPYNLEKKMIHEAVRVIREDDPTPLSSINHVFRGDVEIIIGKALQKEKDRRYQSASDFASDIHRYLNDEPIVARPPSTWYQLRKFSKRNKVLVGGVVAVLLVSVIGTVVSVSFAVGEAEQKTLAEQREQEAREATSLAQQREQEAETARTEEQQRADELEQVAEFQTSQLSGIDAELMGVRLREDLLAEARLDMERRALSAEEITARSDLLGDLLSGANLTNVALQVLERNILDRALKAVDEQFTDQPLVRARLLQALADTLHELGLLDRATAPQIEAIEIRRRVLGDEHPKTLTSIYNMGYLLTSQGRLTEAEPYYIEALETCRRVLGDEHPDTLLSIHGMGYLLQAQGKLAEAEPYYIEAMEGRRRVLGDEHPDTLQTITNMGTLFEAQGKLAEAEPYYIEALDTKRRVLGDEHPETLTSITNMGCLLISQGKLAEAEPYFREALSGFRRVLGDEHPNTLVSIGNMGSLLHSQGKLAEAEPYVREVLDGDRRLRGDEHPNTLGSINNMGYLLQAQGKLAEAEPYFREALKGFRRVLGDGHPNTLASIGNMGGLLRGLGQLEEAEALGAEAVELCRKSMPEGHWYLGVFLCGHGKTLLQLQRFVGGEKVLIEAQGILEAALGIDHDRTKVAIRLLIDLYTAWHEAEPDRGYDAKAEEWRAKLAQPGEEDEGASPETETESDIG